MNFVVRSGRRLLLVTAILGAIAVAASPADAQSPGRYRVISLVKQGDMGATALIIDTETGNVWKWYEGVGGVASGASGSGIVFEGTAVPGNAPGEVVARHGFGLPTIQRTERRQQ